VSNILSIIKEAELSLEKLDGMIDAEYHSKLKAAVDELGASFRKRAYGYTLNELYTVAEMLRSKNINPEHLTGKLIGVPKDLRFDQISVFMDKANTDAQKAFAIIKCEPSWTVPMMVYQTTPDHVKIVDAALNLLEVIEPKLKELLSTNIVIVAGRASDKSRYHQLIRELRKELGLS
jgi:hypothetical protein